MYRILPEHFSLMVTLNVIRDILERFRLVPMFFVMGTIFYLSHQTGDTLNLNLFSGIDKVAHLLIYAVLGGSVLIAHKHELHVRSPGRVAWQSILFCILYALADEYHQSFIPGRMVSAGDLAADTAGAAMVAILYYRLRLFVWL